MSTIHVKTASGFECDINEQIGDDVEILDYLVALDSGDTTKLPKVLAKIFNAEDKQALYDHVRTEDGRVPYAAIDAELTEVFNAVKNGKN